MSRFTERKLSSVPVLLRCRQWFSPGFSRAVFECSVARMSQQDRVVMDASISFTWFATVFDIWHNILSGRNFEDLDKTGLIGVRKKRKRKKEKKEKREKDKRNKKKGKKGRKKRKNYYLGPKSWILRWYHLLIFFAKIFRKHRWIVRFYHFVLISE